MPKKQVKKPSKKAAAKPVRKIAKTAKPVKKTASVKRKPAETSSTAPPISALSATLGKMAQPSKHIAVIARAGTGKTFTEIIGVGWAYGQPIWREIEEGVWAMRSTDPCPDDWHITPSDEQFAVWKAMSESASVTKTIVYCAFNKSIVKEFSEKWGWLVKLLSDKVGVNLQFATINSLGNTACFRSYGRSNVTDWCEENILARLLGCDGRDLRKMHGPLAAAVKQLASLCKLTLVGWERGKPFDPTNISDDEMDELCSFYDVEMNGLRERCYSLVRQVLKESLEPRGEISYNDQNWLPVVNNLPVARSDLVLIDEGQDLNRCKQEFCLRLGRRVLIVGDDRQAIYGFAGADTKSMPRMIEMLSVEEPLRLTETRRCGKAIVEAAQRYVPDFCAHESNPLGIVGTMTETKYVETVLDSDMVLCRVNAPLVSQALRLIKAGRKAVIRGRNFGEQLISFVKKLNATNPTDLMIKAEEWSEKETEREMKKKQPSDAKLLAIEDKVACLCAFADGAKDVPEIVYKMELVFAGKVCPTCGKHFDEEKVECYQCQVRLETPKGVLFSSVHRAKGLEARRVFIFTKDAPMPHPMAKLAWAKEQEYNLLYVAITRAIEELIWVTGEGKK